MTPTVLSIAGSDPSGGAGIQADLKTFSALGAYGATVITALTAQNTQGVTDVFGVPGPFVTSQLDSLFGDLDIRAVKIGMLGGPDVVDAVVDAIQTYRPAHVVIDPVMVAASGDRLVSDETVDAIRTSLVPLATLITPNLPEAATLVGWERVERDTMAEAGHAVRGLGAAAVLIKGGHLSGDEAVDVLVDADGVREFRAPRVQTENTHGTGCTLSSAIAARLGQGASLGDAVDAGKWFLTAALRAGEALHVGKGRGPVHHFHSWWEPGMR